MVFISLYLIAGNIAVFKESSGMGAEGAWKTGFAVVFVSERCQYNAGVQGVLCGGLLLVWIHLSFYRVYEKIREGKGEKSDGTFRGRNRHLFYVGDGPVAVQDLSGQICIFVSRRDPGRTVYFGHPVSA